MYALRLSYGIQVNRADNDTAVISRHVMQLYKVFAIESQHRPVVGACESQDLDVGSLLIR